MYQGLRFVFLLGLSLLLCTTQNDGMFALLFDRLFTGEVRGSWKVHWGVGVFERFQYAVPQFTQLGLVSQVILV